MASRYTFRKVTAPTVEQKLQGSWPSSPRMCAYAQARTIPVSLVTLTCPKPWNEDRWLQSLHTWSQHFPSLRASFSPAGRALYIHESLLPAWQILAETEKSTWQNMREPTRDLPLARLAIVLLADQAFEIWWEWDHRLIHTLSPDFGIQALAEIYQSDKPLQAVSTWDRWAGQLLDKHKHPKAFPEQALAVAGEPFFSFTYAADLNFSRRSEFWLAYVSSLLQLITAGKQTCIFYDQSEDLRAAHYVWEEEKEPSPQQLQEHFATSKEPQEAGATTLYGGLTMLEQACDALKRPCIGRLHLYVDLTTRRLTLTLPSQSFDHLQKACLPSLAQSLLHNFCQQPNSSLRAFRSPEVQSILERQKPNTPAYGSLDQNLAQLLAIPLRLHASRTAVRTSHRELSFAALDAGAQAFAALLQSRGWGPGDLIGVGMPRDVELPMVLLGILRAGAAYVPLDPQFPEDRLRYMIEDSKLKACLCLQQMAKLLPSDVAWLDAAAIPSLLAEGERQAWQEPSLPSQSLAYVIYTSGSTGQPKGVMLGHRSVVNFLLSMAQQPGMRAGDKILAVTTLSFDIAVLELFLPLLTGAQIYLATAEEAKDGRRLRDILEREAITHFQATPSTYRLLLDAEWRGSSLRYALCGGEAFPADIAKRLRPHVAEIWNMYGPTETTVWSSIYRLSGDEVMVPIGHPIAETAIFILDEQLTPLLPGQKGEIYIGGEGLAIGYMHRPDLTAERFIDIPAIKQKAYKTGDVGRIRWDGVIEIFGRADQQVKLRGYRMELGEIEAVVSQLPGIGLCIAAVKDFAADDPRLIAYISCEGAWDERSVRQHMRDRLPSYMLPQHYVRLETFPLLPNGKIDRKRLPHPLEVQKTAADKPADRDQKAARVLQELRYEIQGLPLTPSQARMLFVEELDPETRVHNLSACWILRGPCDLKALRQAWNTLFFEQDALRACIRPHQDHKIMLVLPPKEVKLPWEVHDEKLWSLAEVALPIEAATQEKLDITRAPHWRLQLFPLSDGSCLLHLLTHHIFWDGLSYTVLWRRLRSMLVSPTPLVPQSLDYNFSQYARERSASTHGPELLVQGKFWDKVFAQLPEPLELATDRPRPKELRHAADSVAIPWNSGFDSLLSNFAKQKNVSLYHVLLSGFVVLLHRLSGQEDIVVGTPYHGRHKAEHFELLGNFINILALRISCRSTDSFAAVVEKVKRFSNEALAHADLPFEQMLARLPIKRDLSRTPLYSAMLFFQDNSSNGLQPIGDMTIEPYRTRQHTVDTDMTLSFERYPQHTIAAIHFRQDLWDQASVQAMADAFSFGLEQLVLHPERPIQDFALLDSRHKSMQLAYSQAPSKELSPAADLASWLQLVALSQGERPAVENLEQQSLSYQQLEQTALRWATHFKSLGIQTGDIIGVCLSRTLDLPAVLWGILRVGAAYLPLDPLYPQERLHSMALDAQCRLIVAQLDFMDLFTELTIPSCCLERELPSLAQLAPLASDIPCPKAEDLAYVIYTSGSTGKPKGVEITHGAAVHFLQAIRQSIPLPQGVRTLAITTISFDISVLEIFGTLTLGGTIILVPHEQTSDAATLIEALQSLDIQMLQATPASWRLLMESAWSGHSELIALTGGEALGRDLARALVPRVAQLWNVYGPTEATVWATVERILDPEGPICIGKPLPGYEAYVLDHQRQLLPQGTVGNLFLAGPALARGYRFRPDLTAERFVPHFLKRQQKMYDTGDLVRARSDGRLEYISRRDNQVKLRGYRIELGEIETTLILHPAVRQALCMVREDKAGDQRLVAYVVVHAQQHFSHPLMVQHLQSLLPQYMIPSHLIILSQFPLTGSGKIDKKGLPEPQSARPQVQDEISPIPLSPRGQTLASIFRETIGCSRVLASDHFFDLGGHSLLALQVIHRAEQALGIKFKIRDLLLLNIEQLAALDASSDRKKGALR